MNSSKPVKRLSRKSLSLEQIQTAKWIEPAIEGWSKSECRRYNNFKHAIIDYLSGTAVEEVESKYSLHISQLQEQIWRACQIDPDGEFVGFRALITKLHVAPRVRTKELPSGMHPSASSCSGAFMMLLQRENLYNDIEDEILKRGPGPHAANISVIDLQRKIVNILSERGYKRTEYPFNTSRPLYSALCRLVKRIRSENMFEDVKANESSITAGNIGVQNGRSVRQRRPAPMQVVEADEHKLQAIGSVRITIDGIDKVIPTNRAVGIAIVDTGSGAVIGASVSLSEEAKEEALINAIRSAAIPGFTIFLPDGEPAPLFRPSDFYPELAGALWTTMCLDNAKLHTGNRYLSTASRLGTRTRFGPLGSWSARPNIEAKFGRIVTGYFSRVPSTTGSPPHYSGRNQPAEQAIKYEISNNDLCKLFYEALADINTRPSEGSLEQAPNSVFRDYFLGHKKPLIRLLPPVTAKYPSVGAEVIRLKVCRRSKNNPNMYVSYLGVKYTSTILSSRSELRGEYIIAHIESNLKNISAFTLDGRTLGELVADGYWGTSDHTKEIRQAVKRGKDGRFGQYDEGQPVIYRMLQDKARIVLNKNRLRPKGGTVKGALELSRLMEGASIKDIHLNSPSESSLQVATTITTSEAADHARRVRKAKESAGGSNAE